jgi:hypothetical protein
MSLEVLVRSWEVTIKFTFISECTVLLIVIPCTQDGSLNDAISRYKQTLSYTDDMYHVAV